MSAAEALGEARAPRTDGRSIGAGDADAQYAMVGENEEEERILRKSTLARHSVSRRVRERQDGRPTDRQTRRFAIIVTWHAMWRWSTSDMMTIALQLL